MKIEHTTYEESRGGSSPSRPASATQRVKNFVSTRLSRPPEQERPITMWPSLGNAVPVDTSTEMTTYLTQQRRSERESQAQKKRGQSSAASGGKYQQLESDPTASKKSTSLPSEPKLRHKGKFTIVKDKFGCGLGDSSNIYHEKNMDKLQKMKQDIKNGKLEKTAPRTAEQHSIPAPPRKSENPFRDPSPKPTSRHRKTKSASTRAVEYIGTSADILDETRRELQGKFKPPFENLSYPSFSLSRKASLSSQTSDKSFYCQGAEPKQQSTANQAHASKRLSGNGTDPWSHSAPQPCRLCKNGWVRGVRGLCSSCEEEFKRPKTPAVGLSCASSSSSTRESRAPDPPPKTNSASLTAKGKAFQMGEFHNEEPPLEGLTFRPRVPLKDDVRLGKVSTFKKPTIHSPTPHRYASQKVTIEQADDDEEPFQDWPRKSTRKESKKTQNIPERRSGVYEERSERTLLIGRDGVNRRRNTSFYGFWDDLI